MDTHLDRVRENPRTMPNVIQELGIKLFLYPFSPQGGPVYLS